eukprot:scaffold18793_cov113-Skeletonema_dohrnii-CCMP3373.AAC.5
MTDNIAGIGALERQVIEAALITTRPFSSSEERSKASSSLEQWTSSPGSTAASPLDTSCWEAYINIIRISFATSHHSSTSTHSNEPSETNIIEKIAYVTSPSSKQPPSANLEQQIQREANGAKLLLLTLFCSKIRREYIRLLREHVNLARCVFEELLTALLSFGDGSQQQPNDNDTATLMRACCTAVAAVAVRSSSQQCLNEGVMKMILNCKTSIALSLGINNGTNHVVDNNTIRPFSPTVSLILLADLPGEAQSRNDLPTADIEALLQMPFDATNMSAADAMLDTLQLSIGGFINGGGEMQDSLLCLTLKSLRKWAETCKSITISRLMETSPSNSTTGNSFLSQLVALLSSQSEQRQWSTAHHAEDVIIQSANVLTACLDNTSDFCTQSRRSAVSSMLSSIQAPVEFLVAPLRNSEMHLWEDATVALSNLASTLAREEMEDISTCQLQGSFDLIQLLLELQAHPVHNVALPVLEVWLALQDIPTSDRHPSLATPLYMQLVEVILNRIAFPPTFVSWEEELEIESSDFDEMRRMATDVLIGAYYLLRSAYLETLANVVTATSSDDWEIIEAALFCLCAASREACARVKSVANAVSSGRDSPVSSDGNSTALGLTQLVGSICSSPASSRHHLVLSGMCTFIGSFSTVWASSCPPQSVLEILAYLASTIPTHAATEAAGKGMRLVLISVGPKLSKAAASPGADLSSYNFISTALTQSMEAALSSCNATVMENVAEGCARVCVQLKDSSQTKTILTSVAMPSLHRCRSSLDAISASSSDTSSGHAASQVESATQTLISCLGVLKQLIRFCDATIGETHVLTDVLTAVWPVLKDISTNSNCRRNEDVLSRLFDVHSQLLNAVPTLIGPHFKDIISFIVQAYEETFCASALDYVSAAVESFDSEQIVVAAGLDEQGKSALFTQLLSHIYQRTFAYVQTKGPSECTQVIKAFFEVTQRYLLFCSEALCQCPELPSLFSLGTACLTECQGEIDSTRSALVFLTQFIGWKSIHLPATKVRVLRNYSSTIDNLLLQHGETITKSCIGGISGGAPQILWPSLSECLFAIMLHIISESPSGEPNAVLESWLRSAMTDNSLLNNSQNITSEIGTSTIQILCDLARQGLKSKPKAKMVMIDFGKIAKGETTPEALQAYL